jgi:competence protein ComEC
VELCIRYFFLFAPKKERYGKKENNLNKIIFFILISVFLSLIYLKQKWPDDLVHVFFCDVGQGDGIFIVHQYYQMVIDGGPDDKVSSCVQKFMPPGDKILEVVIATHGDSDHITGLITLLQNYQIRTVVTQAYGKETLTWEKFRQAVKSNVHKGTHLIQPIAGQKIRFDSFLSIFVLHPKEKRGPMSVFTEELTETQLSALYDQEADQFDSVNNEAIALFLTIKHINIAFTSDLEEPIELALAKDGLLSQVHILKAGHHGSKTSNSSQFLNILRPEAVVVSVGKNNRYGHPSPEVITAFEKRNMQIFRTDQIGTIEMVTDGDQYSWKFH